ncbi:hypothetical protein [Crenobacter cavernae]|uniref:Uncharacterized protein n=1 Tax=Crenobacter cavernae TaxID=2290923 RepID=A0ABY0FA32_9NEIS|nr:hypothetical protein [Crenobacter cavernae]RXZ42456.1 hypothetical protein EBB06_11115 [Crenobacter cavernae]
MYDCQHDHYTDFSEPVFKDSAKLALAGSLIARALPGQPQADAALAELEAFAQRLGYRVERNGTTARVADISLVDALRLNACFGPHLLIDCDLRARRAVRQSHID